VARSWFVIVVVVLVACGHFTPSARESPAGSTGLAHAAQAGSASEAGSGDPVNAASDASKTATGAAASAAVHVDDVHGDEAHHQPLDLDVYDATPRGDKLRVRIGLPSELPVNLVNRHWTGVFTEGGKPIPGTDFSIAGTYGREITVDYHGTTLPSRTVRLFYGEDR
jgi:hypothetical protein